MLLGRALSDISTPGSCVQNPRLMSIGSLLTGLWLTGQEYCRNRMSRMKMSIWWWLESWAVLQVHYLTGTGGWETVWREVRSVMRIEVQRYSEENCFCLHIPLLRTSTVHWRLETALWSLENINKTTLKSQPIWKIQPRMGLEPKGTCGFGKSFFLKKKEDTLTGIGLFHKSCIAGLLPINVSCGWRCSSVGRILP